jgi:hypothetical protein
MRIVLGAPVRCGIDVVGDVADVLLDPVRRRLTHVAVQTPDKAVRLVPAELVARGPDAPRDLTLTCTKAELLKLEPIGHFAFVHFSELPTPDPDSDIGVENMFAVPYYEPTALGDYVGDFEAGVGVTYDEIPKGEAELRRASGVRTADGHTLGHVDGFILQDVEVTHVVLEYRHLWRARHVAVPVDAVETIETDSVTVGLSHDEVRALRKARGHRDLLASSPR